MTRSRGRARPDGRDRYAVSGSRFAFVAALLALATTPVAAQELSDDGQTPRLLLGEGAALSTATFIKLPVYTRYADASDGVQITLEFDQRRLRFDSVDALSDHWRPQAPVEHVDGRLTLDLRFYGDLDEDARHEDTDAVSIRFEILAPAAPLGDGEAVEDPFRRRFPVRLAAGSGSTGSFFYRRPTETKQPIPGKFYDGDLIVYYRSGFEIGWGALTNVATAFSLPLYLTLVGDDSPTMLTTGIDYDELFLACTGVDGVVPPLDGTALTLEQVEEGSSAGQIRFDLAFGPGALSGSVVRLHVATLHFRYHGGLSRGDELIIRALLLGIDGQSLPTPPEGGDEGGEGGQALGLDSQDGRAGSPGVIRFLPPYFVRGNVDSSHQRHPDGSLTFLPDVSDVIRVLSSRFMNGGSMPCNQAADADASGSIEVTDAILFLNHLFRAGPPPSSPYPDPGFPQEDEPDLGCAVPISHFETVPTEY